jgi:hypothetical protein
LVSNSSDELRAILSCRNSVKHILETINPEETSYRFSEVESAYDSTLNWLFEESKVHLSLWLRSGEGFFWISGKPGSGKSTAMKHIYEKYCSDGRISHETLQGFKNVIAKFFFHYRGSSIQKSYEGLLRSLLHQILSSTEESAEFLLLRRSDRIPKPNQVWSLTQLEVVWRQVLDQDLVNLRVTLFLDALDEFDGSVDRIVRFVEKTANRPGLSKTQIRVCFASRPWDAFNDQFSGSPGFKMEDHTQSGVSHYIWDNMRNHAAMGSLLKSPVPQERTLVVNLVSRILEEARGVFIWVKLVLEKLLEARTQGAELEELYQVLISLPQELEDLYAVLLTRHKTPDYQREAYAMLEVLLRTPQRLSVHLFRCIVKCATLKNLDECA